MHALRAGLGLCGEPGRLLLVQLHQDAEGAAVGRHTDAAAPQRLHHRLREGSWRAEGGGLSA